MWNKEDDIDVNKKDEKQNIKSGNKKVKIRLIPIK
jgi:hypothetical protein